METVEKTSQENRPAVSISPGNGQPLWVEPDLDFIAMLRKRSGDTFIRCFQCGTCSATCPISPDTAPFPRKEMAWASWGLKDRLLHDPDVWLCYQCNDCSTRCPRGARPGDVLGAVRQESVAHYAVPGFLSRWVNQPQGLLLMLGIPAALLTLAILLRVPIANALGITRAAGDRILYAYSSFFPHWLLNTFFGFFSLLALAVVVVGVMRFWKDMKGTLPKEKIASPNKGLWPSITTAVKGILTHDKFAECERTHLRYWAHLCVLFGFLGLTLVTLWVITASINPLIRNDFIYPFGFWNPWKILANLSGVALVTGLVLMIRDRFRADDRVGVGNYFDWALITTLFLAVLTGFATEVLHYLRLEPHRHIVYFVHLIIVFTVLMYVPYSKLAHLVYRTAALIFAERYGRDVKISVTTDAITTDERTEDEMPVEAGVG